VLEKRPLRTLDMIGVIIKMILWVKLVVKVLDEGVQDQI
jgi:hypothetical protein